MTKPAFIAEPSAAIPASVCAAIRHTLNRERDLAIRNGEVIPEDTAASIAMIDRVGALWEKKSFPHVPSNVPSPARPCSDPPEWITVQAAAELLAPISSRAVTGLLTRGTLHGEKAGRTWRVDRRSVELRKEGSTCQH